MGTKKQGFGKSNKCVSLCIVLSSKKISFFEVYVSAQLVIPNPLTENIYLSNSKGISCTRKIYFDPFWLNREIQYDIQINHHK